MSQLESLLSIAKMQSDQQLSLLQSKKQFIQTMEQQLAELVEYSRDYQQDMVGVDGHVATLLGHRQKFVSQLRSQMDELKERIDKLKEEAEACSDVYLHYESRKNAVESMYEKECAEGIYELAKADQATLDELASLKQGLDYA